MILTVTKKFEFHYAHYLPGYNGPCSKVHGHTGVLEVEVCGEGRVKASYEGMVMDFGDLKRIVQEEVIRWLDHEFINNYITVPTAENMCEWIWKRLEERFGEGLVRVRVYETPTSWAEIRRK